MIDFATLKSLQIPEGKVKLITRKVDGLVLWELSYDNKVPTSINADGSIYNTVGYKNGYRIRSGGAEGAVTGGTCTGFISVNGGDIVRISGCEFTKDHGVTTAINASDSNFTNLGQLVGNSTGYGIFASTYYAYSIQSVVEEKTGVWKWIVPPTESGVAYIRVTATNANNTSPGANLIVTVNEEIN